MRPNAHVKYFIRHKYAWPGGYPMFLLMRDGESLCHTCTTEHARLILRAGLQADPRYSNDSWEPLAAQINYEDGALFCAHCNAQIESAYAEDQSDES